MSNKQKNYIEQVKNQLLLGIITEVGNDSNIHQATAFMLWLRDKYGFQKLVG
jgi:hypothetical protein